MPENALHFKPPLGRFGKLVVKPKGEHKDSFNLKWYVKFMPLFDKFFGEGWKDPGKGFWDAFDKKHAGD